MQLLDRYVVFLFQGNERMYKKGGKRELGERTQRCSSITAIIIIIIISPVSLSTSELPPDVMTRARGAATSTVCWGGEKAILD